MSASRNQFYLDSWDKFNKYRSGTRLQFEPDATLVAEVLNQAGPSSIYHLNNHLNEISNVTKVTTEITREPTSYTTWQYKVNQDSDPVRIVRPITPVTRKQNITVRYLEPPNLPKQAPIIIKERQLTPPPPAPPIVIRQRAKTPPPQPPLVIRERPPTAPRIATEPTIIDKIIPPPTPPPRQVIVERIPAPPKPRDIIYEKWLPYKKPEDRQVIVEKGRIYEKLPAPRNVIIDYEIPNVIVDKQIYHDGTVRADPRTYRSTSELNGELQIVDNINEFSIENARRSVTPIKQVTTYYVPTMNTSQSTSEIQTRPKSVTVIKGPNTYTGPWNTTYKTSYTGRGFKY